MKRYTWPLSKHLGCVSFCLHINLRHEMKVRTFIILIHFSASFAHIAHPIGSMMSGPICDKFGRRKTFRIVSVPLFAGWILLGYAHSFPIICFGFLLLGFCLGVKDAPAVTYCCEIRYISFSVKIAMTIYSPQIRTNVLFSVCQWNQIS